MSEPGYEVFWREAISQIRTILTEQEFSVWFGVLEYLRSGENEVIASVPSTFYRDQIKIRYQEIIETTLKGLTGKDLPVEFEIHPRNKAESAAEITNEEVKKNDSSRKKAVSFEDSREKSPPQPKDPHPQLREDYTFDRYVIGENNNFAANAALAISRNPGTAYNPFLIYGGVGLGKTHLMQAIGNYIHENSSSKIIYTTAENFTNEFIQSLNEKGMAAFKNRYRHVDILLIDDIHFLENKSGTQEELFFTYEALYNSKKQIVFTCDRPVSELKNLTERLRNRFERGLNVDLHPPNYETRFAILKNKVAAGNIPIPDGVLDLISKNVSTNIRDLEAALTKLTAFVNMVHQPVTIEQAQHLLRDMFASPRQANISIELIQKVVAEYFSLSANDLKSKKRVQNIVYARQLAMYIVRDITEYSTTEIGQSFGGRDHTTVMYSCDKIEERMKADPNLEPTIESLKRLVKEAGAKL
ncbi:MAG: chromosomal replication initiator protein DnaA [Treponema sp.]|jgi:chromosomal replication initiator protein|nr:chromosomal replication initiator protein DnaA [Treponema sp.]